MQPSFEETDANESPVLLPFPARATEMASASGLPAQNEIVLGVLPGACESSRTVVLLRHSLCGRESLRLQNESHSPDVGWFAQGCVDIAADQATGLKAALAAMPKPTAKPRRVRPSREFCDGDSPAILSFIEHAG